MTWEFNLWVMGSNLALSFSFIFEDNSGSYPLVQFWKINKIVFMGGWHHVGTEQKLIRFIFYSFLINNIS